jgi:hypothetical protein
MIPFESTVYIINENVKFYASVELLRPLDSLRLGAGYAVSGFLIIGFHRAIFALKGALVQSAEPAERDKHLIKSVKKK